MTAAALDELPLMFGCSLGYCFFSCLEPGSVIQVNRPALTVDTPSILAIYP
jgi:hypothetical protein